MKSIRSKILAPIITLIATSLLIVGGVSSWLNYSSTYSMLKQAMTETVKIASERITHNLKEYVNVAFETGSTSRLSNDAVSLSDKQAIIEQRTSTYGFTRGDVMLMDGKSIFSGIDYSDTEYFLESKSGATHISKPLIDKVNGQQSLVISSPLWKDGIPDTEVVGVVAYIQTSGFLADIVSSIQFSKGSLTYIIDESGTTIAHQEMDRVAKGENIFEVAKTQPNLERLSSIHKNMVEGKIGFESYEFNNIEKFVAYAPISNTQGWSVGVSAPINDFMTETYASIWFLAAMLIVFLIISVVIAFKIALGISRPVKMIAEAADMISKGDLQVRITYSSQDELGSLADSMRSLCSSVVGIIEDIGFGLSSFSEGDFTVDSSSKELYVGDFNPLAVSMYQIINRLNDTLLSINQSSNQVSLGSEQVSMGAQALSQGATEQASGVEDLASAIREITQQIKQSAESTQKAKDKSTFSAKEVTKSNLQMNEMIKAMDEINERSSEISKIIKTIEDIAFQTNILALNAAVEAARAGESGKGFAVVADEVRNLAGKSAQAAKNTTMLIEQTVYAVENGAKIANATAKSMINVVESSDEINSLIDEVAQSSNEQLEFVVQITKSIDNISSVVQTNSATAEESAAASEELSGQAHILKALVGRFKLKGLSNNTVIKYTDNFKSKNNEFEGKY